LSFRFRSHSAASAARTARPGPDASAIIRRDSRKEYGEDRFQALIDGFDGKPYVVVFTMPGETLWVISFRRARERERGRYVEKA
jgi:uncharacterized protein